MPYNHDTGVNGMEVICRGPAIVNGTSTFHLKQSYEFGDAEWGPWSGACPSGSAVCSMRTKVEPDQGTSWGV